MIFDCDFNRGGQRCLDVVITEPHHQIRLAYYTRTFIFLNSCASYVTTYIAPILRFNWVHIQLQWRDSLVDYLKMFRLTVKDLRALQMFQRLANLTSVMTRHVSAFNWPISSGKRLAKSDRNMYCQEWKLTGIHEHGTGNRLFKSIMGRCFTSARKESRYIF